MTVCRREKWKKSPKRRAWGGRERVSSQLRSSQKGKIKVARPAHRLKSGEQIRIRGRRFKWWQTWTYRKADLLKHHLHEWKECSQAASSLAGEEEMELANMSRGATISIGTLYIGPYFHQTIFYLCKLYLDLDVMIWIGQLKSCQYCTYYSL